MIKDLFKGKDIHLIGGGPSFKEVDKNLFKDKITIVINKSFFSFPNATCLYWSDSRFYKWYTEEIDQFTGLKITCKQFPIKDDVINLKNTGKVGLELDSTGIRHGNNSGYAAINLAFHLGASRIFLWGYDMSKINEKNKHWHTGYRDKMSNSEKTDLYEVNMLPYFKTLVEPLKENNVEIFNMNVNSKIKCFPFYNFKK